MLRHSRAESRPLPARAALAVPVALATLLCACSPSDGENANGSEEHHRKPEGEPDALTQVAPDTVADLGEEKRSEDEGGVDVEIAYPTVPGAEPFAEELASIAEEKADDYRAAVSGAEGLDVKGALSAAGPDVLAVRLALKEKNSDGEHSGSSTYWYDTASAHTAYSTELLDGQKGLDELNKLVKERLEEDGVEPEALYPIAGLYDSVGFNPDGDVVVEFDQGQVAPASEGALHAVVPREDAEPLLSDFGRRAQETATQVTPDLELEDSGSPKDGGAAEVPGRLAPDAPGDVDCSDPESKCIALTFDDGPGGRTPEVLDTLAEYDAKATFFVTGEPVRENLRTVRREYAEGHEVANHTVTHPDLTTLGKDEVRKELTEVNGLVARETGERPVLMRPPYGATNDDVASVSKDLGLAEIIWNVDTNDWKDRNASVVADRALKGAAPGAIILMHDIHGTTIDAVPEIVKGLDEKGYTMVTVSQLLGETEPGKSYLDGAPDEPEEDKGDKGEKSGKDDKGSESKDDEDKGKDESDKKDEKKDDKDSDKGEGKKDED
ncbi:polysaccharide deacetylase family protein [Nocardiopsis sp. RSe5-2]|uniref:Polysaccharide deacetylase family protein n=1 Tax=Nocardiopsis endophytica TaxID=3018445 RepID=A0ABT4U7J0_9ACTN|nr:polysaccharide deacetylase family protein [Nocardiopsis endophytica]MDA2812691.1 polysaccharide deacetylase family protein [Nocardiopsis endophytica]